MPRQHLESDPPFLQFVNGVDEVAQVSPKAVQFPDRKDISGAEGLEEGHQSRPIIHLPGGVILIDLARIHPGGNQSIPLQVENL